MNISEDIVQTSTVVHINCVPVQMLLHAIINHADRQPFL